MAAAVTFAVTGGNLAAAFAVYNLVDSVTTAAVNGGDIGRALASAVASAALNFALPGAGSSANFLVNAGVNAARQAAIGAVTAAITGGDPARAALGGLVSGASGVIPYVGTIVGGGAAAEVQGGRFAHGAIGGAFDTAASAGLAWLARSGNLQQVADSSYGGDPIAQSALAVPLNHAAVALGLLGQSQTGEYSARGGRGGLGIYLHGTNAPGAAGIVARRGLNPGSWVTKPYAVYALVGKPALLLNPSEYRAFTGTPGFDKGAFFALIVAPSESVVFRGYTSGGAPEWQVYGEHDLLPGSPFANPNE